MRIVWILAAAAVAAIAQPAAAVKVKATYYGTVSYGMDGYAGIFGRPMTVLTGQNIELSFFYDLASPAGITEYNSGYSAFFGGPYAGTTPSPGYSEVTIGDITYRLDSDLYFITDQYDMMDQISHETSGTSRIYTPDPGESYHNDYATANLAPPPADDFLTSGSLTDPIDYQINSINDAYASFFINEDAASASFFPTRFTRNVVASVGAVPEPATWLSMILGFGLAGAALRRRRQSNMLQPAFTSGSPLHMPRSACH